MFVISYHKSTKKNYFLYLIILTYFEVYGLIREEAINMQFNADLENKADDNFSRIKSCVKGIYEILKITLNDDDALFKMGLDNVIGIYQNFLELMLNDYGARQFMRKLRTAEIEIDIPLDFLLESDEESDEEESEDSISY